MRAESPSSSAMERCDGRFEVKASSLSREMLTSESHAAVWVAAVAPHWRMLPTGPVIVNSASRKESAVH